MPIQIRKETAQDIAEISAVVGAAFGRPGVPVLLDALRRSTAWRDLSFVAVEDERIVGHVAYTRGWVDAAERLLEVLVLSPMSVHPDFQRRGIGSQLIRESLKAVAAPLVFLEGDPAYYSRLGFVAGGPLGFTAPSPRIPWPGFQVMLGEGYELWMKGPLVYPDPFWEHDSVGLRAPRGTLAPNP